MNLKVVAYFAAGHKTKSAAHLSSDQRSTESLLVWVMPISTVHTDSGRYAGTLCFRGAPLKSRMPLRNIGLASVGKPEMRAKGLFFNATRGGRSQALQRKKVNAKSRKTAWNSERSRK
jgi:hypothetical protein